MNDRAKCLENARKIDPTAKLCEQSQCDAAKEFLHRFCNCLPPYPPQHPCPYGPDTPVAMYAGGGELCYCCCSGAEGQMPIAVAEEEARPIDTLAAGDDVLAAGPDLKWTSRKLEFSAGIPPGGGKTMLSVRYGLPAGPASLLVTPDHVFLTSQGRLRRAEALVPGEDELMSPAGRPVPILSVEAGEALRGIHHIATSGGIATGVDGHLIGTNGVVSGDWALQCANIEDFALAAGEMEPA